MRKVKNPGALFGGGGYTGARSVGFAKAVESKGIEFMYIGGYSVGAIIASQAVEQGGRIKAVEESFKNIVEAHKKGPAYIFNFGPSIVRNLKTPALLSNSGIKSLCRLVDWQKVVDSNIQLDIVVTDETSRTRKIFSNRQRMVKDDPDILRKAVIASASIPIFFPPIRIKNCLYSDGMALLPEEAIKAGCKTIFVFLNSAREIEDVGEEIWYRRGLVVTQNLSQWLTDKQLSQCEKQVKIVKFQVSKSDGDIGVTYFRKPKSTKKGFRQGSISDAIDIAYEEGLRILDNNLK